MEKKPSAFRIRLGGYSPPPDLIYLPEAAERIGISIDALQARLSMGDGADIPKPHLSGNRYAWHRAEFDAWAASRNIF